MGTRDRLHPYPGKGVGRGRDVPASQQVALGGRRDGSGRTGREGSGRQRGDVRSLTAKSTSEPLPKARATRVAVVPPRQVLPWGAEGPCESDRGGRLSAFTGQPPWEDADPQTGSSSEKQHPFLCFALAEKHPKAVKQ